MPGIHRTTSSRFVAVSIVLSCFATGNKPAWCDEPPNAEFAAKGFAVVELFTSQGCSSCPSADQNLTRIAKLAARNNTPVYTLSFHVDYWNDLGWNDPFSSASATQRQRNYANVFRSRRIYTPQMVVNGQTQFLGSDRKRSDAVIENEVATPRDGSLKLTARIVDDQIVVKWNTEGTAAADLLNVALVQKEAEREVAAGENHGRTLKHMNIVRDFKVARTFPAADVALTPPRGFVPTDYHVMAFLQTSRDGKIHCARRADIDTNLPNGS